jgi:hypothetical protein
MTFRKNQTEQKPQDQPVPEQQVGNLKLNQVAAEDGELNEEQLEEVSGGEWAPDPYNHNNYKKHIPKGAF